jgi:hypothetical protein
MSCKFNFIGSFFFAILLLQYGIVYSQTGCTDPAATNYNSTATINDGSCIYPVTHKSPVLRGPLNTIITESSGLVWTGGKLWTHNDSGKPAEIYSIDTSDGHILQTVVIDNFPNTDWEDITADSNYIYVGDHGNNNGDRTDLKILKIAKTDISAASIVHVNAQAISFSYTDQTSFTSSNTHNFDCEALISMRDSLYIFTKDRGDMQTRVYKMPKNPGSYALTPYTGYNVSGLITGADHNAHTNEIILIGYLSGHTGSFLWILNDFQGDMFFSGNKRRIEISNGVEWQTEGVAYLSDDRFFISCETTDPIPASLYTSDKVFTSMAVRNFSHGSLSNIHPNPTSEILYVSDLINNAHYKVTDMLGRTICTGDLQVGNNSIDMKRLIPGIYFFGISTESGENETIRFEKR